MLPVVGDGDYIYMGCWSLFFGLSTLVSVPVSMLQRSKRQSSVAIWVLCLFLLAVQLSSRCQSWWSKGQRTIETLHLVSEVGYGAAVLSAHHTEVNMGPKHHHKVVKMGEAAPVESREEGATGGPPVGLQSGEEPPVSADMNSIFSMVQRCLQFQSDLRERWDRETVKQEQRWRQMQVQVNNLRDEVETQQRVEPQPQPGPSSQRPAEPFLSSPARSEPAARGWAQTAVPKLEEGDDIEQYLTTFERLAAAYQWPEVDWAVRLVPYLTGKARAAYVAMAADDTLDYKMVKEAILTKYEINEEVYRQRFREPDIQPGETPREFYNRLRDLYQKWMQPEKKTKEQVGEVLILEQFYRSLSPELRVWVKERNPTSAREAAELVENFLAARRGPKTFRYDLQQKASGMQGKSVGPGVGGGLGQVAGSVKHIEKNVAPSKPKPSGKLPVCYFCGQEGHIKPECPSRKAKSAYLCTLPRPSHAEVKCEGKQQLTEVNINGKPAQALLDTGSEQTLVHPSVLNDQCLLGGPGLDISCVHGDHRTYPTAAVYVEVAGQTYLLTVGVVRNLAHQVILGQDIPILQELVQSCKPVCVVTRSQKQAQEVWEGDSAGSQVEPDRVRQGQRQVSLNPVPVEPNPFSELPYFECDMPNQSSAKVRKSKRQRRQEKMSGTARVGSVGWPDLEGCNVDLPGDFKQLQGQDETLQGAFEQAVSVEEGQAAGDPDREGYLLREGLLFHKSREVEAERLVVPRVLREQVLKLGHSIPWAGHLGFRKTYERIASRFYWAGVHREVQDYCQSCSVCQLSGGKNVPKFPLQPLPIIDVPFSRIAMDIVGPLERTQAGNRFILVVCDYSTRYPEAFPLRDVTAKQIAYALLQLFSRVGIPSEILTDQGTNFLSNTLKQVYRMLGIKSIRTTPYHPQTDGLVERYNRTLKSMLKKFISSNGKDWDRWLPYLLFAYREVPQVSTGFSPFELLYGRQVRGPLDVLQEAWVSQKAGSSNNVLAYVLRMREKMEEVTKMVRKRMERVQRGQQTWYDKGARERSFEPGQQVLLLLPTVENKLLAKWQGPYSIVRKLSSTTYEIEMPERRNPRQAFHINLLKEWKTREPPPSQQLFVRAVKEEEDAEGEFTPTIHSTASLDLSHLSLTQQQELEAIIPPDLFQEKPGTTDLVKHDIHLKDSTPIRQRMYRIPERMVPVLMEEIEVMLELGVIEPSTSEWSNPVVLVIKKDGSIRFCIDFRKVNAQSDFDAYPLPRLDDLIEQVGQARFISTLDLCKGYWQVPLTEAAKPLTAFRTPQGLWQFTKMPFGLQGAPATFQRLMNRVLSGMGTFCAAYLDDIVIYSNSWQEHLTHLKEVLQRIKQAGLTINPRKCALARQELQYLGHILGGGVIKPVKDKVVAVKARERPTTRKQVKSFLGLVGWYRRFIRDFSARAAPLSDLTSTAKTKIVWGEEQERAFQDLKEALCQEPVLQSPNFSLPFTVQTDASHRGIGGVLLQGEGEDNKPVAYISRKLFPRETRYSAVELECLAVKWAIDSFSPTGSASAMYQGSRTPWLTFCLAASTASHPKGREM
ncbi:uncharacterized protein LOC115374014 [Myripristis murdjan]|uniref:uncharacterized protein LOC115374014 n=1 Tax=Myripristis murdjan TaxID=586833 RepID=UPI001175F395|nr:uncharacterized protein LOC115374014 [Myripristis murdjan]